MLLRYKSQTRSILVLCFYRIGVVIEFEEFEDFKKKYKEYTVLLTNRNSTQSKSIIT